MASEPVSPPSDDGCRLHDLQECSEVHREAGSFRWVYDHAITSDTGVVMYDARYAQHEMTTNAIMQSMTEIANSAIAQPPDGEKLLLSLLSPGQRASYHRSGYFEVRGSSGTWWHVTCNAGTNGNVRWLNGESGAWMGRYCALPKGAITDHHAFIGQMLHLASDDADFVSKAVYRGGVRWEDRNRVPLASLTLTADTPVREHASWWKSWQWLPWVRSGR